MTAVMEQFAPMDLTELTELRQMIADQGCALAAQRRMLETLDARREQVDELIGDAMPIANEAMLMVMRHLDAVRTQELKARLTNIIEEMDGIRRAPAPGLFALLRRLRNRDVRKGLALSVAALGAVGRLAGSERGEFNDLNTQEG